MEEKEDVFKTFDDFKNEVDFAREDIDTEDENKYREFFDSLGDKQYTAITLIGAKENQMVGMVGNRSALVYMLAKSMLKDEDLLNVVGSAMHILQGLAYYATAKEKEDERKETK